ncbi:MAG TPA: hypothetical protein VN924_07590 [Bryobacteraceae bacterium]|nr:hypothetical protein [Bryobacteraceae bacterium]
MTDVPSDDKISRGGPASTKAAGDSSAAPVTPQADPKEAILGAAIENLTYAREYLDRFDNWRDYLIATHYQAVGLALRNAEKTLESAADAFRSVSTSISDSNPSAPQRRLKAEAAYNRAVILARTEGRREKGRQGFNDVISAYREDDFRGLRLAARFGLLVADAQDLCQPAPKQPESPGAALEPWKRAAEDFENLLSNEKRRAKDLEEVLQDASAEAGRTVKRAEEEHSAALSNPSWIDRIKKGLQGRWRDLSPGSEQRADDLTTTKERSPTLEEAQEKRLNAKKDLNRARSDLSILAEIEEELARMKNRLMPEKRDGQVGLVPPASTSPADPPSPSTS